MRIAYLLAPGLLLSYGVVRLLDGLDGSHGPGPAWTIGHVLFLGSLAAFGLVAVDLSRRVRRVPGLLALAGTVLGLAGTVLGLVAFAHVVVVDLIVGFGAADRAEMNLRYSDHDTPLDPVAPLFPIGLTVLLLLVGIARRGTYWSPVLALAGFAAIVTDLDLLPVGALLLLGALWPVVRADAPRFPPVHAGKEG